MANTIKLKRGTSTPSTSDISSGEVAIDTSAQKLYVNDSGTVKEIGGVPDGNLTLTSTDTGSSAAPEFELYRNSASPADADYLGQLKFTGESDDGSKEVYAKITGKIGDASSGTEDGIIEIAHRKAGSNNISARFTSTSLKLINGTAFEAESGATITGTCTATTFSGSGASLTNLPSGQLTGALPAIDGSNLTGISISSDAQQNTVGGTNAGDSFTGTDAENNTLFGYNAGTAITTGDKSVAIGSGALYTNTTGSDLVAVGHNALNLNTAGNNVAVGAFAGAATTSGDSNVFVGYEAGKANTTGYGNGAIGLRAMDSVTTGIYNNSMGYSALSTLTTGNDNTAIGNQALEVATTSSENTALGAHAGDNITTGSNNTCIGFEADTSSATASNEIVLGNSSVTKFRIPGLNFSLKDTTATDNYVLTVDSNGDCGWEAAAGGGIDSDSNDNTLGGTNAGAALDDDTYRNTFFGKDAGKLVNFGDDNTAIGFEALDADTGGAKNVAVGSYALSANTSGDGHVAIGYEALLSNTYGNGNVGIGRHTLRETVSGNYNVAVGYYPLYYNTTGDYNVALGTYALQENTTGTRNIAIGYQTLDNSTTTSDDVAVGYQALTAARGGGKNSVLGSQVALSSTDGQSNVYIGYQAAVSATTASYNVGIGRQCFEMLTTGRFNISIGYQGMDNLTTGFRNTAIGQYAGDTLTTGSNNTFVGNEAAPSSATVDNEITLGNTSVTKFRIPGISLEADANGLSISGSDDQDNLVVGVGDTKFVIHQDSTDGESALKALDTSGNNYSKYMTFWTHPSGAGCAEAMRIDTAQVVLVGETSAYSDGTMGKGKLQWGGKAGQRVGAQANQDSTNQTAAIGFSNPNGHCGSIDTSGTSTIYNTSSDYRLKENQVVISDGITRLKNLKPYRFNFKTTPNETVDGFFAHEVQAVVPQAVTGTKDATKNILYDADDSQKGNIPSGKSIGDVKETVPVIQGMDPSKLVPLLTAALQEAIAKIETLETKLAALEAG